MNIIQIAERTPIAGHVRGYELPENLCPDDDADFRRWWERLRPEAQLVIDHHNIATNAGLTSIANQIASPYNTVPAWQTGKIYQQALGSANGPFSLTGTPYTGTAGQYTSTAPLAGDTQLGQETYRKPISAAVISGSGNPILIVSTYFSPTEFWSWSSQVTSSPAPAFSGGVHTFTLTAAPGNYLRAGDYLRFPTASGYLFRQVKTISGSAITLYGATGDVAATAGGTVAQCIAEAGMFGDEYIAPSEIAPSGTALFTNGQTAVTGTSTTWAPTGKVAVAGSIRLAVPYQVGPPVQQAYGGPWYGIATFPAVTQTTLSLTTNYNEATSSGLTGATYAILGTMFNHVNNLNYVKPQTRGLVIENYWTLKGV